MLSFVYTKLKYSIRNLNTVYETYACTVESIVYETWGIYESKYTKPGVYTKDSIRNLGYIRK